MHCEIGGINESGPVDGAHDALKQFGLNKNSVYLAWIVRLFFRKL